MELSELLSNNELVHTGFWLSWLCLGLIAVLMYFIGEEAGLRNTLLTILMPVDILFGTGCAYVGSGILTSEEAKVICAVIAVCAGAVIVLGLLWRSTTTVGLASIGLEFTIISLRLFGGYTAQIMSAFIVLIAFMHGLKKYHENRAEAGEHRGENSDSGREMPLQDVRMQGAAGGRMRQNRYDVEYGVSPEPEDSMEETDFYVEESAEWDSGRY